MEPFVRRLVARLAAWQQQVNFALECRKWQVRARSTPRRPQLDMAEICGCAVIGEAVERSLHHASMNAPFCFPEHREGDSDADADPQDPDEPDP